MIKSQLRGHPIVNINGEWLYKDTMTPTVGNERPCGHCGKPNTNKEHDGCLGTIPGVMNACCGHGNNREAYRQYFDNSIITGNVVSVKLAK